MIQLTVYGPPLAQGRPRFTTAGGFARAYDPADSRDYKQYIKLVASQQAPKEIKEGPLELTVRVYRPIPKAFSKKKRAQAENGEIRPTTKPDGDNYLKLVSDALNQIIWRDDSQIVDATVRKFYSETPRLEIDVRDWGKSA